MCIVRELLNDRGKLRLFQLENGLHADGIAGPQTIRAIREVHALEWVAYNAAVTAGAFTPMHLAVWVGAEDLIVQDSRFNVYEIRTMSNVRADLYQIGLGDFSKQGRTRLAIVGDLAGPVVPPKRYRLYTWHLHIDANFEEDLELHAWMAEHQITRSDEWPDLDGSPSRP